METNTDDTNNTVIDNTKVDSQNVSLPLTSSTPINTNYIVSSLLDDPSLTSDEESNKEENTILGDVSNNEITAVCINGCKEEGR